MRLCTKFQFKQCTLKFWDQIPPPAAPCRPPPPQKGIFGTEYKKTIAKFRICTPKYSFVLSFILNKALWSFETKFAQKKVPYGRNFKQLFLKSKSAALNTPLYRVSLSKKHFKVWGPNLPRKRYFRDGT